MIRYSPNQRPIGFVYKTRGGFWRAYCFDAGLGTGPFETFYDAETEVKRLESDAAFDYHNGVRVPPTSFCRGCGVDLSRHGHAPECECLPEA